MTELDWKTTKATDPNEYTLSLKMSFLPRNRPYNVFVKTEKAIHEIEPTEYFIGFCNGLTAVGMAKDLNNLGNKPLTMQFGTLNDYVGKKIYPGCTLMVRSYMRKTDYTGKSLIRFAGKHSPYNDIFFHDRLSGCVVAAEWAVVNVPKLKKSLGYITEFHSTSTHNNRLVFHGKGFDQESNLQFEILDEQFPSYIHDELKVETAFVASWVDLEEPHSVCYNYENRTTLLPSGASILNLKCQVDEIPDGAYWLRCIDTHFV